MGTVLTVTETQEIDFIKIVPPCCGNCEYWNGEEFYDEFLGVGKCNKITCHSYDAYVVNQIDLSGQEDIEFITRKSFSCSLHKVRE